MLRKIFTSSLLSLVIVGGFFVNINPQSDTVLSFADQTYAADNCGGTGQPACTSDQEMVNMYNKMIQELNIALDILSFIVSPAIMLAGWLMSPDWTSGDLFELRPILHDLWVLVSNITYFIYALLLIFIALATIFNSQNYGYKKLLPRLALGIILVPMTWWFVQFVISLSTIVTASVMNMPTDVMSEYFSVKGTDSWWVTPSIPNEYEFYTDDNYVAINGKRQYNPGELLSPKDILTKSSGIYGALLIYGNGLFKFNEIETLSTTKDVMQSIGGLVNKGILGVVMFVVFGFLVMALIFMLLMRAIKLWFYAIFSPLLTLRYVVGDGLFGGKENSDSFELKEFVGLAFVPALVGLALSFGIVVIAVLQSASLGNAADPCDETKMQPGGAGCQILGIMGNSNNYIKNQVEELDIGENGNSEIINVTVTEVKFGGVSFKFYGSIIKDVKDYAASASTYTSTLSATGGVFGTLIIDMIALIFLWSAFMAAKNVSKVAKAAFEPFESIGKRVGKLAMDIPKYTPIPGTGGLSLKGAEKLANNAQYAIDKKHEEEFKGTRYGKMFGGDKVVQKYDEDYIKKAFNQNNQVGAEDAAKKLKELLGTGKDIQYSTIPQDMAEALKKQGSETDKLKYLKWMGYDNDTSQKIIDRLKSTNGEAKAGDTALIDAIKSIGSKPNSNSGQQFTATKVEGSKDDEKKVELKFNDSLRIQVDRGTGDFKDDDKLKQLRELAKTMTESEFKSRFSGVGDGIVNGVVSKLKSDFKPPTTTTQAQPQPNPQATPQATPDP